MYRILTSCVLALSVVSCGNGSNSNKGLSNTFAYDTSSPYANVLKRCISADTNSESCKVSMLPPIAMDSEDPVPSIDLIMSRVVVSHEWMGDRVRDLLARLPDDIRQLLGGVTAVVIDDDTRPSYYWSLTGAIYLDPQSLWITQSEYDVISKAPDYREAFSDPMSFRSWWRYTRGNEDPYYIPGSRSLDHIILPMASLLFHELAHANDLLPVAYQENLNPSDSILRAISDLYGFYPSTSLSMNNGLQSDDMYRIAGILYLGATPSQTDTELSAAEMGAFFEADVASDDYSYSSQYEDVAMIFEEVMMKYHYNIDRDMAFVNAPEGAQDCNDYTIGWGVRNRLGDPEVKARAEAVVAQLLPGRDFSEFFASFPEPQALAQNVGWCASQVLDSTQAKLYSKGARPSDPQPVPEYHTRRPYRVMR